MIKLFNLYLTYMFYDINKKKKIRAHIKIRVTPVGASNAVSCYESIETILWKSNTRK